MKNLTVAPQNKYANAVILIQFVGQANRSALHGASPQINGIRDVSLYRNGTESYHDRECQTFAVRAVIIPCYTDDGPTSPAASLCLLFLIDLI